MQMPHLIRNKFCNFLILIFATYPLFEFAQKVSQYDTQPLLKQARLSFESHNLQEGESLLEEYIQTARQKFPMGYTFGFEAAEVADENLNDKEAVEVIKQIQKHYGLQSDLALRQGIDASLLKVYKKAGRWSDGTQLVNELVGEVKTNFILNITVLDFNRALASLGKTNEAVQVSKQYFGDGENVTDQVVPSGFWMQKNAETAFMLNQPDNSLQILNNIEKTSPEYYRTNQVAIILLKINALEQLAKYSEIARQLALANGLSQKGYPVTSADQKLLQYRLKAYQRAGWLDGNYKANQEQLYIAPYPLNHRADIIRLIILCTVIFPPLVVLLVIIKRRIIK
jgi:hypothetical protein